ncbi:hypothetical protein O6H91_04G087000 [Diphasiastrum complanatum]|uniref:Uncharacterized protein n=2 Tax=Diphasiastrum complanatum TaxID=34168 RepID=A0ACC2DZQ0_DIPCM|nr:hypothetical protein O6H91_04G087000 [Diphasiastrum complanatum]KAJ7559487.1 hypothetical protein O6H91_04G087000 [Diphasiastrum complanatum]
METISPAADMGNFDWLSDFQLDTFPGCEDSADSNYPYLLTQMEPENLAQGFPLNSSMPLMKPDNFPAYGIPPKVLDFSSWEAISDQTGCSWSSPLQSSYASGEHPGQQRFSTSKQHMSQRQFCLEEVDVLSILPKAQEESYEHLAPKSSSLQWEMRHPPGLASETFTSGAHVMETSKSSCIGRNIFSRNYSRKGKRKASHDLIPATVEKSKKDSMDHIIAERKRREKLNQRFIALSALIPGLKKMDKASILGDGISYVRQLQENLKRLEGQAIMKCHQSVSSNNLVKQNSQERQKIDPAAEKKAHGCREKIKQKNMPKIETCIINGNILIRIQCEKKKGILGFWLTELEKLHISVINASMLSSLDTHMDLAFTAQIGEACHITADGLVSMLQTSFKSL